MAYVFTRLHLDEEELLRRVTHDGADYLIGPIPGGPKPRPLKAQRQPSPKPRVRRHTPVADALAAWDAYVARRHAKGGAPA
jgi:hypothetical protein